MGKALKNNNFYADGLNFSCKRCSTCCRFEAGFVFLSKKDVSHLAAALDMNYNDFIMTHCRWIPGNDGKKLLSLQEKPNYDCIFWSSGETEGCSLYEKRPLQCRLFPFWESIVKTKSSWDMTARDCPGMNQGTLHSENSIEKMLSMRQSEVIISRDAIQMGEF